MSRQVLGPLGKSRERLLILGLILTGWALIVVIRLFDLQVLAHDKAREDAHRGLMRLYAAMGARTEALRQYDMATEILQKELGVEPARKDF